jgi:hypothetical protein
MIVHDGTAILKSTVLYKIGSVHKIRTQIRRGRWVSNFLQALGICKVFALRKGNLKIYVRIFCTLPYYSNLPIVDNWELVLKVKNQPYVTRTRLIFHFWNKFSIVHDRQILVIRNKAIRVITHNYRINIKPISHKPLKETLQNVHPLSTWLPFQNRKPFASFHFPLDIKIQIIF